MSDSEIVWTHLGQTAENFLVHHLPQFPGILRISPSIRLQHADVLLVRALSHVLHALSELL